MNTRQTQESRIILVGFWPDYEEMFFRKYQPAQYSCHVFNPLRHHRTPAWLPRPVRNYRSQRQVSKLFQQYPTAIFIVQEHRLLLEHLLKTRHQLPARLGIMMRNRHDPASKTGKAITALQQQQQQQQQQQLSIFSFDTADCQRYGFHHYHQFAEHVQTGIPRLAAPNYDFCFVGRDKGRREQLAHIQAVAGTAGYTTQLDFREADRKATGNSGQLSYTEYLSRQLNCRCIIDLNQPGQSGMTLRPLEAALYGKKLLSNNVELAELPFFDPHNIYLLHGDDSPEQLTDFMRKPFRPPPQHLLNRHLTTAVVNHIAATLIHLSASQTDSTS